MLALMVMKMANHLVKKTDIDHSGLWVRPVRLESSFGQKTVLRQEDAAGSEPYIERDQMARIRHLLHDLTTQLAHDKQRLLDELRPHVVRLAIGIARRIVAAEIRQDRRIVERTVKAALDELACEGELQVHVHPDDRVMVERAVAIDGAILGRFSDLRVVADPGVERGGCVLESDHGIIDANIPTQFARIQRTLLAYLEQ